MEDNYKLAVQGIDEEGALYWKVKGV